MINRLDTMEKTQIQIVDALLVLKEKQELILTNQSQTSPTPRPQTSPTPRPKTSPTPRPQTSPTPRHQTSPTPRPQTSSTPRPQTSSTPRSQTSPTSRPQTSSTPRPQTSSTPWSQTSSTPRPLDHLSPLAQPPPNLPIGEIVNALPSSAINKDSLSGIEEIIDRYPKLQILCKAGSLACKLAREAIFGEEVLKQCTPKGNWNLPGLPSKELEELKRVMFTQYPQLWRTPVEFEPVWQRCLEAVQQASKCLRLPHK